MLAASPIPMSANSPTREQDYSRQEYEYQPPQVPDQSSARRASTHLDTMLTDYGGYKTQQQQQYEGFQNPYQGQMTVRNMSDEPNQYLPRDSLFLPTGTASFVSGRSPEPTMTMGTMESGANYAFNPEHQAGYKEHQGGAYEPSRAGDIYEQSRAGTMLDSQQGYFSDFAGQQAYDNHQPGAYGGGPHRYSSSDAFSPTVAMAPPMLNTSDLPPPDALEYQMPLEPRDIPFDVYDPHDGNTAMSKFDNLAAVLRHRGRTTGKMPAYWVLDNKGKETSSITWDKLASRAEKVAQVIRDKSSLYRGDRVALIYRDTEIIDFAIALLGCFIAGVVAVPINDLEDYQKLNLILTSTQAHLALTTDNNLKAFQRDITTQKLNWPRGVEWWKTNEFGSFHPKRKDDVPPLAVPDLAYIEFSRAPTGDLRGVVMSHRTIMHQMACLSAVVSTIPSNSAPDTFNPNLRDKSGRLLTSSGRGEILLTYLDPRQGIGMIMGVLLTVYGGHTTVWMESKAVETPGLYANLITKYRATLMLADYPGLKRAAYNYQQDPMTTRNFKKGMEPNFQHLKLCLIDTLTVDCEFHEVLADRWLRPMRNPRARELVCPMLCLPEHGGMVISMRDWLGGEERMGCPLKLDMGSDADTPEEKVEEKEKSPGQNGFGSLIGGGTTTPTEKQGRTELGEVLLDREALKTNEVVVVAIGEEARKRGSSEPGTVRVGAFGFPIPDATLSIVDPESGLLASAHSVGEIWVDSPSLSGGFWALPKHTEQIFHARPYKFEAGNPTPTLVEPEFLRTGLLGTVIEGKVYVLGLYEDRLRQKVEWVEHGHEIAEFRYFFVQHIIVSIMKNVPKIYDCSAFDVFVNDEHLPIVLLESQSASTAPTTSGGPPRQLDTALLDSLSERCMEVLMQEHHLRVYCVMITAPNSLPKVLKNGRKEIGNMLCRREFDLGNLPCVHVKFGVERAVLNLPIGVDPIGGIWSPLAAQTREDILSPGDKQYSGIDRREVVIDDRTSTPLNNFSSIVDLLQWRVARQAEELSYCTIDGRGKEGKGITWKKLDMKVAAVAMYLKNKVKIRAGDHLILMYTHSEDFVYAVHACFCLGATAIPMAPLDQNRLNEDAPAFLHMVADYRVKAVLVNQDVDHLLKQKAVSQHLKQSAQVLKTNVPPIYNTTKPPKQSSGCRDLGLTMQPAWVQPGYPVLVWTYWTPDQRRIAVQLGHDTIMGTCKVQKETCQMTSSRPVLGCVRSTSGLGFIHTCLMGVFVGAPTYLVSPVEFAQNPISLFLTLSRYKIKDTYATPQMLDHAMAIMPGKGFALHELKNMMISAEGRPRVDVFQKVRLHFASTGLDRTAINTIYSHVLNPMIASRSYMCIEPIELWLDTRALRRGLIYPVDPDADPKSLLVQDSGMVPVSTQIAIVNPESRLLCHDGEYGEIWVESEACVKSFYGSKDLFDAERFDGRTIDGDPSIQYVRTGDLGFLHNVSRPIGPNGALVDMQVLFVLGSIGETFEINGLSHFPMDIEISVEKCHRSIVPGGS
jgi:acyl-CoA synthetase (AMP-forming)/AMP-acid ligase II